MPTRTAEANWKMAQAQSENAQHKLDELQRGYRPEEIAAAQARYEQAAASLAMMERGNRPEDVALAKAAYSFEQARFRETQVVAPTAATVEVLDVRPGDQIRIWSLPTMTSPLKCFLTSGMKASSGVPPARGPGAPSR